MIKGVAMKGFCLWKREHKGNAGYYQTECGQIYMGTLGQGRFVFCPFCKGYVISTYKQRGKCYTEQERMMFENDTLRD